MIPMLVQSSLRKDKDFPGPRFDSCLTWPGSSGPSGLVNLANGGRGGHKECLPLRVSLGSLATWGHPGFGVPKGQTVSLAWC